MSEYIPSNTEEPSSAVKAFISAMNTWERDAQQQSRAHRNSLEPYSFWPEIQRSLLIIHQTFCTPKRRVYASQPSFQHPPAYGPAKEKITSVSVGGTKALVDTQRKATLGGGQYRYVLHKTNGKWLVDNVKFFSNEKWKPHIL